MNFLKNCLFRFVFILALGLSFNITAAERSDLYESGKLAYDSKNYVVALKNLYAFYVINIDDIEDNPLFKKSIEEKLAECEVKLSLALVSNKSIDMSAGKFILRSSEIDSGFSGTGKQVQELLKNNSINLEKMMKHRQRTSPSSEP